MFLNTHNLTEAEKLCAQVGVIRQGKLLTVGSPDALRIKTGGPQAEIIRARLQRTDPGLIAGAAGGGARRTAKQPYPDRTAPGERSGSPGEPDRAIRRGRGGNPQGQSQPGRRLPDLDGGRKHNERFLDDGMERIQGRTLQGGVADPDPPPALYRHSGHPVPDRKPGCSGWYSLPGRCCW